MADRPYDIVLFGATGFTGGLTAEYLARHTPRPGTTRDALGARRAQPGQARAGPSASGDDRAGAANLDLLEADIGDPTSMRPGGGVREGRDHHRRPLHPLRRAARSPPAPRPAPTTST